VPHDTAGIYGWYILIRFTDTLRNRTVPSMDMFPHFIRRRRLLLALLVLISVAYVQLDRWQRNRIFAVETSARTWWREPPEGTEVFDLRHDNGETIRAWYWPSPTTDAPTVLYLHGARWNLNGSAFRMQGWADMGYSMLAIDYRGFGASSPRLPSERSAAADARLALAELARRQPDPARRFVYGHSLGGAIAIDAVTDDDVPIAGLIVEAGFTRIADMLATQSWGGIPGLRWIVTQPFDAIGKIAAFKRPVLFLHGTADTVVPPTMSDALFAAAREVPPALKRLVKLQGVAHSNGVYSGARYRDAIQQFTRDASRYARSARSAALDSATSVMCGHRQSCPHTPS